MLMPGFSADAVFAPSGRIARAGNTDSGDGGGTIVIDGNCECIQWETVGCVGPFGSVCIPFLGCTPPIPQLCLRRCVKIRCTPS